MDKVLGFDFSQEARDAIDECSKNLVDAYHNAQEAWKGLNWRGPYPSSVHDFDWTTTTPTTLRLYHDYKYYCSLERMWRKKKVAAQKKYGLKRCTNCRKWLAYHVDVCPSCHYTYVK